MKNVIVFLILAGWCAGADYTCYVANGGTATTWAAVQVAGTPAGTLDAVFVASQGANSAAGDTITIKVTPHATAFAGMAMSHADYAGKHYIVERNGTSGTVTIQAAGYCWYFGTTEYTNATQVTFNYITFPYVGANFIFFHTTGSPVVTCNNCILDDTGGSGSRIVDIASGKGETGSYIFNACTINARSSLIKLYALGTLKIYNNCVVTCGGQTILPGNATSALTNLECRNSTFTSVGGCLITNFGASNIITANSSWIVEDCTLTDATGVGVGLYQQSALATASICRNVINTKGGIRIGSDVNPTTAKVGKVICVGNTGTCTTGHNLALLDGADGGYYADNVLTGGNFAGVFKGSYNVIVNNTITGKHPCYVVGTYDGDAANGNIIRNNKFSALNDTVFTNDAAIHYNNATNNVFTHNIVLGGTAEYALSDSDSDTHGNNFFDYNIYYPGTAGLFLLNSNTPDPADTIVMQRAAWAAWTTDGTYGQAFLSDTHSKVQSVSIGGIYTNMEGTMEWIGIPQAGGSSGGAFYNGYY